MADDLGFGVLFGLAKIGVGALFVVSCVGMLGGLASQHEEDNREKAALALVERADDTLTRHKLTKVTLSAFKKLDGCDADHPQGADFIARDASGKLVEGKICTAPNRDNVLFMKP